MSNTVTQEMSVRNHQELIESIKRLANHDRYSTKDFRRLILSECGLEELQRLKSIIEACNTSSSKFGEAIAKSPEIARSLDESSPLIYEAQCEFEEIEECIELIESQIKKKSSGLYCGPEELWRLKEDLSNYRPVVASRLQKIRDEVYYAPDSPYTKCYIQREEAKRQFTKDKEAFRAYIRKLLEAQRQKS